MSCFVYVEDTPTPPPLFCHKLILFHCLVSRTLSCGMTSASTSQNHLTCCSSTGTVVPPSLLLGTWLTRQSGWILAISQETASPKIPRRNLTSHNRFVCDCVCTRVGLIHLCAVLHESYLASRCDFRLYLNEWVSVIFEFGFIKSFVSRKLLISQR